MAFLRSSFFIAIVSLFVLTGYSWTALADCCRHESQAAAKHALSAPLKQAPADADDCQCLCHQAISHLTGESLRLEQTVLLRQAHLARRDEFPPDALPLGIDYPPQLS